MSKKISKVSATSRQTAKNPFVAEEVEGFFEFEPDGHGSFQFGYVRGQIDYRLSTCEEQLRLEFSWDGNDEMDPAQGRGWVTADRDQIEGMLFFHQGDESKFKAARRASIKPAHRKRLRGTNLKSK